MTSYNEQPAGLALPDEFGVAPEKEQWIRDLVWTWMLLGDVDPEAAATELVDFEEGEISEAQATKIVAYLLQARQRQQASFGDVATPTRDAFAELAEVGVLARENFTCCSNCLSAEIWDELTDDRTWYGYLAYHRQDAERLVESGETYVSYGLFPAAYLTEEEWDAMGEQQRETWYVDTLRTLLRDKAFPILEKHGITVTWDGDLANRILLKGADYYAEA